MSATAVLEARPQPPAAREVEDAPLTIEVRTDVDWSLDDLAALDLLLDDRPHIAPFLSHAWLSGLFAVPPRGFEPSVLMFRAGGALRGLVPLGIRHTLGGARITLLGGGYRSDRVDVLAARGYEPQMADMFVEWLDDAFGEAGYVLELRDVPGDSALWGAIRRAIDERERPFVLMPIEVHAMPYLPLDERDTESPGDRGEKAKSIAKHRRLLDRRGRIEFERLEDADSVLAGVDTLAGMLRARWGAGTSALDNAAMLQFQRHVLPRLQAEGRLRMMLMLADRRPIGVCNMVTFGSGAGRPGAAPGRWYGYLLSGYDREWAGRIHLGRLVMVASIQLAASEGAQEFDFLKGPERFKYYWPVRERVSIDANLYSGTFRTQVTRARDEGRHAAVALFKSMRGLIPSLPQ